MRRLFILFAAVCLLTAHRAPAQAAEPPRLVLLVVMDQLSQQQLVRFGPALKGGLARMAREGRSFDGHYAHAPTYTAPGHATLATGASPRQHGITSNKFRDTDGRFVSSVEGNTPKRLLVETVGDRLRAETRGRAKVVSLGLKDRAAMLSGGHAATLAVWFSKSTGQLVSRPEPPPWLRRLNAERPAASWFGKVWHRRRPDMDYVALAGPDVRRGEDHARFDSIRFPHAISAGLTTPDKAFYGRFRRTPWATELTFDAARRALEAHALGADDVPDLLILTLAASDYIGHVFGPSSHESLDHLMAADEMLGAFFDHLDSRLPGRWAAVFSADHGVAPLPEITAEQGLPAGRINKETIARAVEKHLGERVALGRRKAFVEAVAGPWIYLERPTPRLRRLAREAVLALPGVHSAWTSDTLAKGPVGDGDRLRAAFAEGYYPGRSGDVVLVPRPNFILQSDTTLGTSHLTPYIYDAVVPVMVLDPRDTGAAQDRHPLMAPIGSRRRRDQRQVAPTLARLLGITPPAAALLAPLH